MPAGQPPPSFYDNVAAMGPGAGAPKPPSPNMGSAGDAEVLEAFKAIFKAMAKMEKAKPELKDRFAPINQMLKATISDVMKVDPNTVDSAAGAEAKPPETVQGNKSPQEATAAPPDNKSPQELPVPA